MLHDFRTSLERSNAQADAPWWPIVYRAAFPDMVDMKYMPAGSDEQRRGIDRIVTLRSGKQISIDEKVRDDVWPDIALERWCDWEGRRPGWLQKALYCDYLNYAFKPSQQCHLLPFQTLRRAWRLHGKTWCAKAETGMPAGWNGRRHNGIDGFSVIHAQNPGYVTESIGVPIPVLYAALSDAMLIRWNDAAAAASCPADDGDWLEDMKWLGTLVRDQMERDPELPEDQARRIVQNRIEIRRELSRERKQHDMRQGGAVGVKSA